MRTRTIIQEIASLVTAIQNCQKSGNSEWEAKHGDKLRDIERNQLPHGSGIDSGCDVDVEASSSNRIVINVPYHCMDENGFYDGWRDYKVIVKPAFDGIDLNVTGRDYNGLKDYLGDLFYNVLMENVNEPQTQTHCDENS